MDFKTALKILLGYLTDIQLSEIAYSNIDPNSDCADDELVVGKSRKELIDSLTDIISNQNWRDFEKIEWLRECYNVEL